MKIGGSERRTQAGARNRGARRLSHGRELELVELALQRGTLQEFDTKLGELKAQASRTSDPAAHDAVDAFSELLLGTSAPDAKWPGLHALASRIAGTTTIVETPLAEPSLAKVIVDRLDATCIETRSDGMLTALALVASKLSVDPGRAHAIGIPCGGFLLARQPGVAEYACQSVLDETVDAVDVDNKPLVCPSRPPTRLYRVRRVPLHDQRTFGFVGPKTLGGREIADIFVTALNDLSLRDERSPLRTDVSRLATLAFALSRPTVLTEEQGAIFLGGKASRGNIRRFWDAARELRVFGVVLDRHGRWLDLAIVSANPFAKTVYLAPPWWWTGKGAGQAWRPSGALFRPVLYPNGWGQKDPGSWPGLLRTLSGFEARLCWGPSAGRGRGGSVPDALRPVSKGGPGAGVWVPWRSVLMLAGEPVPEDADANSRHGRRYRRRVAALREAGYCVTSSSRTARAEDTVEIVNVVLGRRSTPAGLVIRATRKFCEAANGRRRWERWPLSRLFETAMS